MSGYYKGISAKIVQTVTNAAIMLTLYEKIQRFSMYMLRMALMRNGGGGM